MDLQARVPQHSAQADARDRARRLFEFLKHFEERRSPARTDLDSVEWRLYLSELPRHACVQVGPPGEHDDVPPNPRLILSVARPQITECLPPPSDVELWLEPGWKEPEADARLKATRGGPGRRTAERFDDDPRRSRAMTRWVNERARWAEAERPARAALTLFERVLDLWARLQRDGGAVRVLLGDGQLIWKRGDLDIHHPLLLQEVELRFDEKRRELSFLQTDSPRFLYSELLARLDDLDGERRKLCRTLVDEAVVGGGEVRELLQTLAPVLGASDDLLPPEWDGQPGAAARLQLDPVLFLVPRASGFRAAYEAFLERLPRIEALPIGVSLAVSGPGPAGAADDAPFLEEPALDLLSTKPSNAEQERIVRRLAATGAVLVQGPPGTGKTHTIANLIGHLLAHGKSVLVTAQTSKALRVLREKVVDELKPLCVSVLDSDSESRSELEHAVHGIVSRLSSDSTVFQDNAERFKREREELRSRLQGKERDLRSALQSEIDEMVVGDRGVHPSEAGRRVFAGSAQHGWLPGPVEPGVDLPLSEPEVADLYRLAASVSAEDEAQLRAGLPPVDLLMRPDDFGYIAAVLGRPAPREDAVTGRWTIARDPAGLERLAQLDQRIRDAIAAVEEEPEWARSPIHAGLLGGPHLEPWAELAALLEGAAAEIVSLSRELLDHDVHIESDVAPDVAFRAAEELLVHLGDGGGLGWLSRLGKPAWRKLLDSVRVGGRRPRSFTELRAVKHALRIELLRNQLRRRWDALLAPAGVPLDDAHRARPEVAGLARLPELRKAIRWAREEWSACVWEMEALGIPWDRMLEGTSGKPPHAELWRVLKCAKLVVLPGIEREQEKHKRARLEKALARSLEALRPFKAGAAQAALGAMREQDPEGYRAALDELNRLWALADGVARREQLLLRLSAAAPTWAASIRDRQPPHQGPGLPGNVQAAWEHRQLVQELDRRLALDPDALQREVSALKEQLQRVTCSLVENLAWSAQAARTDAHQHRALMSWLDLVKRVGKGTGKRAEEYRRKARAQLDVARASVPVWIMPLSRVAESFVPGEKLFDVVILDEASQCDVTALIAFALGRSVVVVGDDEQVSPMDVGQNVDEVRALQDTWLDGFRDQSLFDGRASAYELGRRSFPGGLIRLVEHFRCVPDIIAFSNRLSYRGEIRPLRERCSARVFPPIVAHRLPDGLRVAEENVNRAEALEVASLVAAVTALPEYAGLELGVISLLGEEQVQLIDGLLQRMLDPATYRQRRILCGTAAQFQGDERDVVFLSLVDSPGQGPLRKLDREDAKKRYNVAASRARDQLWIVHSLDLERDLKPGDFRRELLEHALDPTAWSRRPVEEGSVGSELEGLVLRRLRERGYRATAQVEVGAYRVDLVVEGRSRRVAIECDGERFQSPERLDQGLQRQAILERLGWRFIRVRGSAFYRDPDGQMDRVFQRLEELGVERLGQQPASEQGAGPADCVQRVLASAAKWRQERLAASVEPPPQAVVDATGVTAASRAAHVEPLPQAGVDATGVTVASSAAADDGEWSTTQPVETLPQAVVDGAGVTVASRAAHDGEWSTTQESPTLAISPPGVEPEPLSTTQATELSFLEGEPHTDTGSTTQETPTVALGATLDASATPDPVPPPPPQEATGSSDRLFETVATLLPRRAFACTACGGTRKLTLGPTFPVLQCLEEGCGATALPSIEVLKEALREVDLQCACGAPVKVLRAGRAEPTLACSTHPACGKVPSWQDLGAQLGRS